MVSAREALAAHLCEEFDEDFRPLKGAAWPENEADDGKREGGYIAIQPKHVQARAKEAAARILAFLAASPSSPASGVRVKALEWETIDEISMWATVKPLWWCYRIVLRADRMKQLRLEMLGNRNEDLGVFADWQQAKDAAQEHFDAILSALGEHP